MADPRRQPVYPYAPPPSSRDPDGIVVLSLVAGLAAIVTRAPIWAWASAICLLSGVSRFSARTSERSGLMYAFAFTASAFAFAYVPHLRQGPPLWAAFTGGRGGGAR